MAGVPPKDWYPKRVPGPACEHFALVVVVKQALAVERAAEAEDTDGAAVTYEEVAVADEEDATGLGSSGELSQAALGPSERLALLECRSGIRVAWTGPIVSPGMLPAAGGRPGTDAG